MAQLFLRYSLVVLLATVYGAHGCTSVEFGGHKFRWSFHNPVPGYECVHILEGAEPKETTWRDNYFCSQRTTAAEHPGFRWSSAGPIRGMKCTQIYERADPHTWHDNYLCVPCYSPLKLSWSSAGPIAGRSCVQWLEPSDSAGTWHDNFLCFEERTFRPAVWPNDFRWSPAGSLPNYNCVQIREPAEPPQTTWNDNYFCSSCDAHYQGFRWSYHNPLPGMRCTRILELADPHTWQDNYLCVPHSSSLHLLWNSAGPIAGKKCIRWYEGADNTGTWGDNYLCKN